MLPATVVATSRTSHCVECISHLTQNYFVGGKRCLESQRVAGSVVAQRFAYVDEKRIATDGNFEQLGARRSVVVVNSLRANDPSKVR